ncbi:unnamed protein product [Meganyctiphanes norvegica]|uniref:MAPK regulated corepressor interacting protein 2 n=1 Tax=Meganyctiphanes norvegica TaxID=48144 RepID=A0AAV2QFM9_MEGNR
MYNVSRGPSRIINRTRRDITQKLESLDQVRELTRKSSPVNESEDTTAATTMSSPRPTFQQLDSGRGKGGGGGRSQNGRAGAQHQPEIPPQHEELIRYFSDSWNRVCKDMEMNRQNGGHDSRGGGGNQIIYYSDEGAHQALENFVPFDLEAWWGKRIYQKMTQST